MQATTPRRQPHSRARTRRHRHCCFATRRPACGAAPLPGPPGRASAPRATAARRSLVAEQSWQTPTRRSAPRGRGGRRRRRRLSRRRPPSRGRQRPALRPRTPRAVPRRAGPSLAAQRSAPHSRHASPPPPSCRGRAAAARPVRGRGAGAGARSAAPLRCRPPPPRPSEGSRRYQSRESTAAACREEAVPPAAGATRRQQSPRREASRWRGRAAGRSAVCAGTAIR
mmetsp:Transcript_25734/g.85771  ORF Transcript_25734/g.85771 Transcript_25734/m.85771 type:complete len:226 (-) Transcript_25734:218-895(-)